MNRWLAPDLINRLAADPARCSDGDIDIAVDLRRPFVPEHHTQLYFTPLYASLHFEHRLRYNQLFGLRINEYVMMLEADLVERLLTPLLSHARVRGEPDLQIAINTMIEEERRHCATFARLNRTARPDLYPPGEDRLFSVLPLWTRALFWGAGMVASRLAFALWYLMAMEESSMALARDMQRKPETETLGLLDAGFVTVHLEHMKDEARHLHIDGILIDLCIGHTSSRRRTLNARLFRMLLPAITTPTRNGSGIKVIRKLVREMPELQDREAEMIRAVLALRDNAAFQESLFNRSIMPMTFRTFDTTAELAHLGKTMVGYERE